MVLALSLLGPMQMTLAGATLTGFRSDKERALLFYLALERDRVHAREQLVNLFWGEQPQALADNNLRKTLHRLRQTLGDGPAADVPFLLVTPKTVTWNPAAALWLDVVAFDDHIQRSQKHAHRRAETCQICQEALAAAAGLYRGGFLEGFWLVDSPAFDEWVAALRERCRAMVIAALVRLIAGAEAAGMAAAALAYARRLAAIEPWQESAQRAIMRLYAQAGQRPAALHQYHQLAQTLQQEMGIAPETATIQLYERIKNDAYRPAAAAPNHLPLATTPLIGREQAKLALQARLQQPDCRLISLVGPGGVGKTRLALAAANAVQSDFGNGAWFVDMAALAEAGETAAVDGDRLTARLVMMIAAALNLVLAGSQSPRAQLLTFLRDWDGLLLLDNFETALAGVDLVGDILRTSRRLVILATSREPLQLGAEEVIRLGGLSVPPPETDPGSLVAYESMILFQTMAARAGAPPSPAALPIVADICRFLDGSPLGLELAAAWAARLGPAEVWRTLQTDYETLAAPQRDVPERHRTLQAVFSGSWRLLTPGQQTALAQTSLFRGGFTRAAAEAVLAAPWFDVVALVDKSLLQLDPSGRYHLHELLRQFAATRQQEATADPAAAVRHRRYYLNFLAARTAALWGQTPQTALDELRREFENIHVAWQAAVAGRHAGELQPGLASLVTYYSRTGLFHEGIQVLRQTLATLADDDTSLALQGWLQVELARLLAPATQFEAAAQNAAAALALAERLNDAALIGWSCFRWARTLWMQGHYDASRPLLERALAAAQANNLARLEGECWLALGALADTHGGDFLLARSLSERALDLFRQEDNRPGELRSLNLLGNSSWGRGDFSQAQAYYEASLALSRAVQSQQDEAAALANLGTVLREQGALTEALASYEPALQRFLNMHDRRRGFVTLQNMSLLLHQLGQQLPALDYAQRALAMARELDTSAGESQPLCCLGHALLALNRPEEAAAAYARSVDLHRQAGNPHLALDPLAGLVRAALAQNDLPAALTRAELVLRQLTEGRTDGVAELIRVWLTVYQVFADAGDERAGRVLAAAHRLLRERAAKISDPDRRQSFLDAVPAHQAVRRLYAASGSDVT